jgi:hypothetical protein
VNRPAESRCSVQADIAVTVGLLGNAIATDVANPIRVVVDAPSASSWYGSHFVSSTSTLSSPSASA